MARKKQEIALQNVIETQEEWEEMLSKEGLTIVDIYQDWAGPCKAMVNNFRRMKNELGDELLHFSVAKADTVDALERYRGKCEPCFLFYAGGTLVNVIRGANSPLLLRTLTEQLAHEHKVIEGNAQRTQVSDTALGIMEAEAGDGSNDEDMDEGPETKKGVTLAILKPNVVSEGKVDEIIEQMKESGIDILETAERTLTEEEAREFYAHQADQDWFPDLISYMTSGPSMVLVITKGETGEGIVDEWRELLGPPSVEEAKSNAPESFRAKYGGGENYVNSMHGSDSADRAMTELAFFFPDFNVPTLKKKDTKNKERVQRTLALIRPDAMRERKDEILAKIRESGFTIAMQKEMRLTKEQAEHFYKEHEGQEYFEQLTMTMSSGPLLALALARDDAVSNWREMLGPKTVPEAKEQAPDSLRAQFVVEGTDQNQLHGSDSVGAAQNELDFFFPMQQTVAVVKPDAYNTKEEIMAKIKEAGFHIAAKKETELTEEIAKQFYKDQEGKDYYNELTEHMAAGPTLFMILSREDAVDGWRSVIGPTDPEKAKEENPDSIRAIFGKSLKENAVHGSSSSDHAKESIKLVFGDVEFNADGTVKERDEDNAAGQQKQEEGQAQEAAAPAAEQQEAAAEPAAGEQEPEKAEGEEAAQEEAPKEGEEAATEGQEQQQEQQEAEPPAAAPAEGEDSQKPEDGETTVTGDETTVDTDKTEGEMPQQEATEGEMPQQEQTASDMPQQEQTDSDMPQQEQTESDMPEQEKTESEAPLDSTADGDNTEAPALKADSPSPPNDEEKPLSPPPSPQNAISPTGEEEAAEGKKSPEAEGGEAQEAKPATPDDTQQAADDGDASGEQQEQQEEQKPDEGEQKAEEEEQKPEDAEQKADDGEQKADDGEQMADDGEQKADDGEQKADDGEQKADDGEQKAEDGEQKEDGDKPADKKDD